MGVVALQVGAHFLAACDAVLRVPTSTIGPCPADRVPRVAFLGRTFALREFTPWVGLPCVTCLALMRS